MKIFFDLDGPILDVSQRYYQVFLAICKRNVVLGKEEFWECKRERISWSEILKKAKVSIPKERFMKYWMCYIEMRRYLILDKIQPYVKQVLRFFGKRHILYLVSIRQSKRNLLWQLRKFKIEKYFRKVVHCKHTFNMPWKEKARLVMEFLRPKEDGLMIGDTEVDIRAAKIAGIKSIGITNGIRTERILKREKADFLISNLNEVFQILT
ncbi:MAG: hypothetical protein DRP68_02230 [Candidatus Omnitrophota bacterium]|nr:MAG: hypothetical protein DRP68_02230 [Candidatus Omnitrophota bacterium]